MFNRDEKKAARAAAETERQEQIEQARAAGEWWAGLYPKLVPGQPTRAGKATAAMLKFEADGIVWGGITVRKGAWIRIPWESIEAVDINGETTSRVTMTRALGLGLLSMAAKKKSSHTRVIIATAEQDYAFDFEVDELRIKEAFRPLVRALAAKTAPEAEQSSTSKPAVADELAKLADLREQGILSDDEFASAKARLLA